MGARPFAVILGAGFERWQEQFHGPKVGTVTVRVTRDVVYAWVCRRGDVAEWLEGVGLFLFQRGRRLDPMKGADRVRARFGHGRSVSATLLAPGRKAFLPIWSSWMIATPFCALTGQRWGRPLKHPAY